jgi:uncharacterized protein (DUF302 family)
MKTLVAIKHVSLEIKSSFSDFTYCLEKALGVFNPALLACPVGRPASMASFLHSDGDEDSLVLFNILEFDELLKVHGRRCKVKQYQIGNTAIALMITQRAPAAGLYMPLRLIVYECADGRIKAAYDLPSTLLAGSDDRMVKEAAVILDGKLAALIAAAEKDALADSL